MCLLLRLFEILWNVRCSYANPYVQPVEASLKFCPWECVCAFRLHTEEAQFFILGTTEISVVDGRKHCCRLFLFEFPHYFALPLCSSWKKYIPLRNVCLVILGKSLLGRRPFLQQLPKIT